MRQADPSQRFLAQPDGTLLGLNVSRFDERQRRQRLQLPKSASGWDYAPLIELVVQEPGFDTFRFVGQTAAERLVQLRRRNDPGIDNYIAWYEGIVNRLLPILARRPRIPDNYYGIELAPLPLIASLPSILRATGPQRATAAHWSAAIRAMTEKGLKSEELNLSGVLTRLHHWPAETKLSKAQVLRLVDLSHAVPKLVCESRYGFAARAGWHECCDRVPASEFKRRGLAGVRHGMAHVRFRHRSLGWSIVRTRFRDLLTDRRDWWVALDEKGRLVDAINAGFASPDEAIEFAELQISRRFARWGKHQTVPRWERFALPGGDDYRELLVQLDDWPETYRPRHYRTRNVLVHVRSSIRQTIDGHRVLFLDEVQSDWHADLHAQAKDATPRESAAKVADAPFKKEWPLLAMKIMLWWAQRCGVQGLAWSSAELQEVRWQGYCPPELLYRTTLPDAARALAKTLRVTLDTTSMLVRSGTRFVALGSNGWEVQCRGSRPITKPFRTRAQAERFADQTGNFIALDVPVIWMDRLAPITSIPLFGAGPALSWTDAAASESTVGKN